MKKVKITEKQLRAIADLKNDCDGMIGVGGESDELWRQYVIEINKFLKSNGLDTEGKKLTNT